MKLIATLILLLAMSAMGQLTVATISATTLNISPYYNPTSYLAQVSQNGLSTGAFGPNNTYTNAINNAFAVTNINLWSGPIPGIGWFIYGSSPNQGDLGELVASNLFITATHVYPAGYIAQFEDTNGNIYYDGISNDVNMYGTGLGTLCICVLSNSLPASVPHAAVMAPSGLNNWPYYPNPIPLVVSTCVTNTGFNTNGGSILYGFGSDTVNVGYAHMNPGVGPWAWNTAVTGDSGSPVFTMWKKSLIYMGAQYDTSDAAWLDDTNVWNGWMATGFTNGITVFTNFY